MRTLVVEDDAALRRLIVDVLQARGHDVLAFASAERAWDVCQREEIPLIILDWQLPGWSGLELCRRIRGLPSGKNSVILVVTGRDRHEDLEAVLAAGADDYLAKPFDVDQLDVRLTIAERRVAQNAERKQMEEQLLRAQRLEVAGRIAGQVAHDFNNLLGPLVGYPELIKQRLPPEHPAVAWCDQMLEAALRIVSINDDLLTLGRRGHVEQRRVDLNDLVKQAIAQWLDPPPATLTVMLALAPDLLPIRGSDAQLLRVLSNLISNARDAMDDTGQLTISTENVYLDQPLRRYPRVEVGEYVRLSIQDTGHGIPEAIRERMFDAFFTTKNTEKRRGTGLGLTVVQAIVEDHRGYVDVESEVGRGTTFSVYLPVAREMGAAPHRSRARGGNEMILVVDDDAGQRAILKQLLVSLGYRVEVVESGEAALVFLSQQRVDLLLLDLVMPAGINGVETYRQAVARHPGQRALLLSGFGASERLQEAQTLGIGGFIRKPVRLDQLAEAVRAALDR